MENPARQQCGHPGAAARGLLAWELASAGAIVQRILIVAGLLLAGAGLAWPWLRRLPFGRLPGDIHIVRDGVHLHFPIVSCLLASVLLSILLWILRR